MIAAGFLSLQSGFLTWINHSLCRFWKSEQYNLSGNLIDCGANMRCSLTFALVLSGVLWISIPIRSYAGAITSVRKAELTNLVRQDCGSCHGMTLKGGLGKPLLPENLTDNSINDISDIILDGVQGTPMPPWRGLLTRAEADWIAEQLKSGMKSSEIKP